MLDKAPQVGAHQSGHNSGVIHSGIYYRPGSKKAQFCREGKQRLTEFCSRHNLPYDMCGKVIIATEKSQLQALKDLYERGLENRIEGLRIIDDEQLQQIEPNCRGIAAVKVGSAGIVDYSEVCRKLADLIQQDGGRLKLNEEVIAIREEEDQFDISATTTNLTSRALINCAGLQADRVARLAGHKPSLKIIPFRGEYYKLRREARSMVNGLIYPLPNENFPFLGVHCTKTIHGEVECGPNAVWALARESYSRWGIKISDVWDAVTYKGFRKMAGRHWRTGLEEVKRSYSKKHFVKAVQTLIPNIQKSDLISAKPGIRATAVDREGRLVDDFEFIATGRQLHVLNAPSPAATSCLKLGDEIAEKALRQFKPEEIASS